MLAAIDVTTTTVVPIPLPHHSSTASFTTAIRRRTQVLQIGFLDAAQHRMAIVYSLLVSDLPSAPSSGASSSGPLLYSGSSERDNATVPLRILSVENCRLFLRTEEGRFFGRRLCMRVHRPILSKVFLTKVLFCRRINETIRVF